MLSKSYRNVRNSSRTKKIGQMRVNRGFSGIREAPNAPDLGITGSGQAESRDSTSLAAGPTWKTMPSPVRQTKAITQKAPTGRQSESVRRWGWNRGLAPRSA